MIIILYVMQLIALLTDWTLNQTVAGQVVDLLAGQAVDQPVGKAVEQLVDLPVGQLVDLEAGQPVGLDTDPVIARLEVTCARVAGSLGPQQPSPPTSHCPKHVVCSSSNSCC